jgi:hypothetical protein
MPFISFLGLPCFFFFPSALSSFLFAFSPFFSPFFSSFFSPFFSPFFSSFFSSLAPFSDLSDVFSERLSADDS